MKRATPLLLAILLGALAAGIGFGVFLKLANDDRNHLSQALDEARAQAEQTLKDKQALADDANQKVEEANAEVAKAEQVVASMKEEQRLMLTAKKLAKPPGTLLRNWSHTVSLYQGVGFSIPPKTEIESDSSSALTAVRSDGGASLAADTRWLSVTPYEEKRESELLSSLATSTGFAYLIGGTLVTGREGVLAGTNEIMTVLRVRSSGTSSHLIWIKDPGTFGSGNGLERFLATFEFNS